MQRKLLENFWLSERELGKEQVRWDNTRKDFHEVKTAVFCLKGGWFEEDLSSVA